MLVLGISHILKHVQIHTGRGTYTCPTKEINGELFFKFKNEWHKVIDYVNEYTHEHTIKNTIQKFKK